MMAIVTTALAVQSAILSGNNGGTGTGLIEVYDLTKTNSAKLANISTRGLDPRFA